MNMQHTQFLEYLRKYGEVLGPRQRDGQPWFTGKLCDRLVEWAVGKYGQVKQFATCGPWVGAQYHAQRDVWGWLVGTLERPENCELEPLHGSKMSVVFNDEDEAVARLVMKTTEDSEKIYWTCLSTDRPEIIRLMCEHFMGRVVQKPLLDLLQDEFVEVAQRLSELA